ncbi:hypothetical protein J7L48_00625 [bacterium]|nr:hypothetical protein [bacterium]
MEEIKKYEFGKMTIGDREFTKDLIITPTKIIETWRRKKSHLLILDDLAEVMSEIESYRYFLCGTGSYGKMKISQEVFSKFRSFDILYFYGKTVDIKNLYNEAIKRDKNFVAVFHLTC